jgi:hypothetical protein
VICVLLSLSLFIFVRPAVGQVTKTTILIQPDGTISPSSEPIQRAGDKYIFTADVFDPILIQKSNITIDGAGYALIGPLTEAEKNAQPPLGLGPDYQYNVPYIIGLDMNKTVNGIKIENLNIKNFNIGVYLRTTRNSFINCGVTGCIEGILLTGSANIIEHDYISDNKQGLFFGFEQVDGNIGNIPSDIIISQNSFNHNEKQLSGCVCETINYSEPRHSWDNGKEGNFWSDYNGTDTNGDGIGDSPYIIDALNQDRYPLIQTVASPPTAAPVYDTRVVAIVGVLAAIVVITAALLVRKKRKV